MLSVRPVSDLRNKFVEISEDVHESGRPAILTRSGCDDMVVTSTESFEELSFHSEVLVALRETEREAAITQRFSLDEVLSEARSAVARAATVESGRLREPGHELRAMDVGNFICLSTGWGAVRYLLVGPGIS